MLALEQQAALQHGPSSSSAFVSSAVAVLVAGLLLPPIANPSCPLRVHSSFRRLQRCWTRRSRSEDGSHIPVSSNAPSLPASRLQAQRPSSHCFDDKASQMEASAASANESMLSGDWYSLRRASTMMSLLLPLAIVSVFVVCVLLLAFGLRWWNEVRERRFHRVDL